MEGRDLYSQLSHNPRTVHNEEGVIFPLADKYCQIVEIVQTVNGDPPERAHHLSLPQLLLPASPLAAALISGNKNGRKFSICSWQQILSLQAPAPPPHTVPFPSLSVAHVLP